MVPPRGINDKGQKKSWCSAWQIPAVEKAAGFI
jgi:hypothetical protein